MTAETAVLTRSASTESTRALTAGAYALLGVTLCWSRLVGLTHGYCCDEIRTVSLYVNGGPREILAGPYIPNNHELFSLLGWLTFSLGGESEVAIRLWSVLPFLLGVALTTVWLHRRAGPLSGIAFLFLATASPLLLDISRMGRGYGLAFLAMSVLVIGALEAVRTGSWWAIAAVSVGGLLGSLTLPHFALTYAATCAVLLAKRDLRARLGLPFAMTIAVAVVWYAPHVDDIAGSSLADYGQRINSRWLVTAPVDQTLVPALTMLDDSFVRPNLQSLLFSLMLVAVAGSSPLLRARFLGLVLCVPVVTTVVAFWLTGTYIVPRFFSFLLVPLFVLLATGSAAVLVRLRSRPAPVRTAMVVAIFGVLSVQLVPLVIDVSRMPRDATSEAGTTIRRLVPASTPVVAHVPYPDDISFFLGRRVEPVWTSAEAGSVCRRARTAVYVDQPYLVPEARVPCVRRAGTRHYEFRQYTRGERIDVWVIPPEEG
jgi:hypothetical protein